MAHSERSQASWDMALKAMPEINAKFANEDYCEQLVLGALAKRKTIQCRRRECGHMNKIPDTKERAFPCRKCRKQISLTAKTFFHKKQKFKARLVMLELVGRNIPLSASQLAELCKVSTDTINNDLKKLAINTISELKKVALEILSELCLASVSRRTRKTPLDEPPIEEEFALQKQNCNKSNEDSVHCELSDLQEQENCIFKLLCNQPVQFDKLHESAKFEVGQLSAILLSLELKGLVKRQPGDVYAVSQGARTGSTQNERSSADLRLQSSTAQTLVHYIKDYFQGVGRKNLQLYAALHWLTTNKKRWRPATLLKFCVSSPYVSYEEILEYVTPLSFYSVSQNTSQKKRA